MTSLLGLVLSMAITGYTCDVPRGQPYCGLTSDGTQVRVGVAACPSWMPFGTVLRIDGEREVTCHDRGPANAIDVWLPTIEDCFAVTRRAALVEVVGPVTTDNEGRTEHGRG